MKMLSIACIVFSVSMPLSLGDEDTSQELVTRAIEGQREFTSQRERLDKLVAAHNKRKIDWKRGSDVDLQEAFASIQKPFRKTISELAATIKAGDKIEKYPGILALGKITFDPTSESYRLVIDWGYGSYEDSWVQFPQSFEFNISVSGVFLDARRSPMPQTE
jgi:hypothetical protein